MVESEHWIGGWSVVLPGPVGVGQIFPSISPRYSSSEFCYGITHTVISIAISVTN